MFRIAILCLFFLCLNVEAQVSKLQEVPKVNFSFNKHGFVKKPALISYRVSSFKFTLKPSINGKAVQKTMQDDPNLNFVGFDFRTKYYLTKRVHLIIKTKFNGASTAASIGVSYIFGKK